MIECISREDYKKICEKNRYYKGRWRYFRKAISLINNSKPTSALELGPYKHPIMKNSDVMDIKKYTDKAKYVHDASIIPWPINDKKYDLFVALQVWEHLGDKQKEAFKEVIRISRSAILSFPLNWQCEPGNCHNGITEEIIAEWTNNIEPIHKIKVGKRIVYMFNF